MRSFTSRPWKKAMKMRARFDGGVSVSGISRRTYRADDRPPQERRTKIHWLDLRGSGLSVLERLLVEEVLWKRQDTGSWVIAGHHEPADHRYLAKPTSVGGGDVSFSQHSFDRTDDSANRNAVIVMGIGGKPQKLLDLDLVKRDQVPVLRRFSGGGTVVLDSDSIWTTVIGRNDDNDGEENDGNSPPLLPRDQRYPRTIMEWSMSIYGPLVEGLGHRQQDAQSGQTPVNLGGRRKTMIMDTKSCAVENTGRVISIPISSESDPIENTAGSVRLSLREHDYVLGESRKVAGNAQSIGKSGWLHHTSWLWDASWENMSYLSLPDKRPAYRDDRTHADFLTTLRGNFPQLAKRDFYACLRSVLDARYDVTPVTLPWVMKWIRDEHGDLNQLLRTSRTRVVDDFGR